jgi:hypothetical protein
LRFFLSLALIFCGSLLVLPASAATWEQRVLKDEHRFVTLGQEALRQPAIQDEITNRIVEEAIAFEPRLTTEAARALGGAVVEELPESNLGEDVLQGSHALLVRVLEDRSLRAEDDTVVLDLRPVVDGLVAGINSALPPSERVEVPPEIGRIVLVQEKDFALAFSAARVFDRYAILVALSPVVAFALAILVAPARLLALALCGIGVAVAAGVLIALLDGPLATHAVDAALISPGAREAAMEVYEVVAANVIQQEYVVFIAGLTLAIGASVLAFLRTLIRVA